MPTTGTMKYLTIGDSTYEVYNTDTEVIQTYAAASGYTNWRPLVVGYSSNSSETTAPTTTTGTTYTFNTIKVKPSDGIIRFGAAALYNGDYTTTISADTLTAARTLTAPDKSGMIALTSDIPSLIGYATTTYVDDAIAALPEPMLFKGSVGTDGTITSLPAAAAANEGFTYKVITALSTPVTAKVGDTVISTGSEWVVIPSGDEPSGTVTSVGLSNATDGGLSVSGSPVTSSGTITIGHSNVLTNAQTTEAVYPIKIDKNGHISSYGSAVSITDEKLGLSSIVAGSTYYPIVAANNETSTAVKRQYDSSFNYYTINGTTTTYGQSILTLGNSTASGTANNKRGELKIYGTGSGATTIIGGTGSGVYITLPSSTGTLALTSDIPDVSDKIDTAGTGLSKSGTTLNHSNSVTAQTTQAVYPIKIDAQGHISAYGSAVTIPTIPSNNVTGSGSTDYLALWSGTNTLSSTSLSISTSYNSNSDSYGTIKLYVGSTGQIDWKGQLVLHDGSSSKIITITPPSLTTSRTITLPDKTGTVALTDDLPTVPTISLNGSSTTSASFYAPTTAGTDGYYLKSNGSGAPTWSAISSGATYTATSPISIDSSNVISHEDSGVTAGTYDGGGVKSTGFYVPSITVDAKGHVTSATDLGNLIPVVTSSNSNEGGNVIGTWTWALATRSYSAYPSVLAAGNTSKTITISSDSNSAYTYAKYFRVVDVEAFDAVTKEPVIVDWSASALYSNNSSVTVTVSIASAYTNNIWLYVLLSVGYGSM